MFEDFFPLNNYAFLIRLKMGTFACVLKARFEGRSKPVFYMKLAGNVHYIFLLWYFNKYKGNRKINRRCMKNVNDSVFLYIFKILNMSII